MNRNPKLQGPFRNLFPLCLASASPRRKMFLRNLGLDFFISEPGDAEPLPACGEDPADFAARSAGAKARSVAAALSAPRPAVIAADTVVTVDGLILGKPRDPEHGLEMLRLLKGRAHRVISACVVLIPVDGLEIWRARGVREETIVRFWNVPDEALAAYAFSAEPADKAGGYAVTGAGAFMVRAVEGSINNVVGLPLISLTALLLEEKIIAPARAAHTASPLYAGVSAR